MIKPKFLTKKIDITTSSFWRCPSCRNKENLFLSIPDGDCLIFQCSKDWCAAEFTYVKNLNYLNSNGRIDFNLVTSSYKYWINESDLVLLYISHINKRSSVMINYDLTLENHIKIKFPYTVLELKQIAHKMKNRMLFL